MSIFSVNIYPVFESSFCLKAPVQSLFFTEETINWELFNLKVQGKLKKQEPVSYLKLEKKLHFNSDNLLLEKRCSPKE